MLSIGLFGSTRQDAELHNRHSSSHLVHLPALSRTGGQPRKAAAELQRPAAKSLRACGGISYVRECVSAEERKRERVDEEGVRECAHECCDVRVRAFVTVASLDAKLNLQ